MLFNSPQFIFVFLPSVFFGYFLLSSFTPIIFSRAWLAACSLFFYGFWNPQYIPLILFSVFVNFFAGRLLILYKHKKTLIIGIIFNIALLGYYKYFDFFLGNINNLFSMKVPLLNLLLPLAISFFTFQQLSYLVDCYKGKVDNYNFINYILFITFFPHLIAGPIVHHKVMMPQFQSVSNLKINFRNIALGMFCFSIGLFKKVILADKLSVTVLDGMINLNVITFFDAWIVILSYTFQLYFDFSGYSDMAIGLALLFNIKLPINFNSPYKSTNFQEMVSRWHITLTSFLYEYVYYPLNRKLSKRFFRSTLFNFSTRAKTSINLLLLMLISGIWHGAGWNFIVWGMLMGAGIVIYRAWSTINIKLPLIIAWGITFVYLNFILVFFKITDVDQALIFIKALLGFNGFVLPEQLSEILAPLSNIGVRFESTPLQNKVKALSYVVLGFFIVLGFKNTSEKMKKYKPTVVNAIFIIVIFVYSILNVTKVSEFLYFKF